ncbi:hypothetical protein, partial [Heyndrickxia faecalis]
TLNQFSSASFSLDFYNPLVFKFLPKLSASLPNLGILLIQQALNWLSYPQFDLGDGNGYFFLGVVGLFMAAKIQQHFFIWSSYTSVFAISTDARNRGTFSYG